MDQPALIVALQRSFDGPEELFRFDRSPVHIGRGPRNELRIEHAFVSHQHGVLRFDAAGVEFMDLGSTNGSRLDSARLESHRFAPLYPGDQLTLGVVRLRVKLEARAPKRTQLEVPPPSLEAGAHAASLAAVIERFAASFLALSHGQHAWRQRIGLACAGRSGLHALADPMALIAYLLAPGHEASRLQELDVACEELLCNERALLRALAEEPVEEP